ncbi:hypothetical protein HBH56_159690 [Parastagonospora nodorum]|uniref:Heterokaryon incompatibility domain-containing protein n=2 Tax=Phaeosphaeria nodorum (strain SN15 / ATCC MYA-4574 / FGSC 10173) TaxID=321614 RepID=A0A7U2F218_PHANO|nr:hypothetical protein HBH56_159690 [Parastagonospora nodorum]QRC97284.1 hypothetical protein JI435_306270 [Parastagonospora nodorum SN15]KAH3922383.1 hypothetical protein HBH54_224120 [Parastagonospora nodorum]KAH3969753.1 hypothetical protein HBH52_170250 [Parastagonospora nodorum]KAH3973527.1 hypothetical protein HBH51_095450 [Parastagonospora nodorum]
MSFSYDNSDVRWKPTVTGGRAQIRILELHPLPWYLWWLPRPWALRIPLYGRLSWAPLADINVSKRKVANTDVKNVRSSESSTTQAEEDATLIGTSKALTANPVTQSKPLSISSSLYPKYKALSYTWGDGKERSNIYVNGKNLDITLSLATALHHLRYNQVKPLNIWIDQICINQQDNAEKTEQVRHMDCIYRNAEEALVWLGPAQNGSEELLEVFNKVGTFVEDFDMYSYFTKEHISKLFAIQKKENPEDAKTIEYHAFCDSVLAEFTYTLFESLIAFYKRPWFNRAWVVQEFSLPPEVTFVCGTKRIKAETLMCVIQTIQSSIGTKIIATRSHESSLIQLMGTWVDEVSDTIQPFFSSRQRRKKWDEGEQDGYSLYTTLHRICVEGSVQATQGCDMVYGLLGLVNDAEKLNIRADYSTKNHQAQVIRTFTKTARAIINTGKVDLLMSAQYVKLETTLPSWVPDWRSGITRSFAEINHDVKMNGLAMALAYKLEADGTLLGCPPDQDIVLRRSFTWIRGDQNDPVFAASNKQLLKIYDEGNDLLLALDGYIVDEIEDIGGPWTGGTRFVDGEASRFPQEEYLNLLATVRQMCVVSKAKGHDIYPTSERRDEAYWRVPVGGLDQEDGFLPVPAGPACKLKYEHCVAELEMLIEAYAMTMPQYKVRAAELVEMGKRRVDDADPGPNLGTMYRIRMQEMAGKRPFISNVGYVGMGPRFQRAGDKIAIFNGATVPFIIRPVGEESFKLIGECYCDGIMFGEFVQKGGNVQKIVLE